METLVLILGGILALIAAFFAGNKRGENKAQGEAKVNAEHEQTKREAAGNAAIADAAKSRQDIDQEVRDEKPSKVREELRRDWVRPGDRRDQ